MSEKIFNITRNDQDQPFLLSVDSNCFNYTVTTILESCDYRLRSTVAEIWDWYENGEIITLQWIPGRKNISHSLTKRNPHSFKILKKTMVNVILDEDILSGTCCVTFVDQRLH